jgi:peptidoglycan hydrolase-like protein with peptidoglycan-binding domain
MTFKRSSSMILVGATALVALGACAPKPGGQPQAAATQAMPSADVPITDLEKAEIQAGLNKLGYGAGAVDGFIGRQSREAIRSFQADVGAEADGYYSPALLQRVRAEAGAIAVTAQPAAVQPPRSAQDDGAACRGGARHRGAYGCGA